MITFCIMLFFVVFDHTNIRICMSIIRPRKYESDARLVSLFNNLY